LVPEGVWIAGQPHTVTDVTEASLTIGGPGMMAYRYRINGGVWSADTPIGSGFAFAEAETTVRTATLQLSGLTDGVYTVDVIGQDFAGNWQDESSPTTASWTIDRVGSLPLDVVINEVLARNTAAVDLGGMRPDVIELLNRGAGTVDLSGFSLTDDIDRPNRYVFPDGTMLGPGEYLVVYADSATPIADKIHLGFGLKSEGEGVFLID
jgi:lamin tail-like protein